ncbi:MGMT family protein [Vibrio sp. SM6]|uniref:MGMT family protein n=1 Tax=Vibrio agarilyticus TaxID=2726741 RepID=A0A7X8YH89_9VIBR|nr:MGMT family protein [Vibrio agarilyticus]NLS13853.1 MGMT family protein [Vibrio agarilyticus]
MGSFQQQIFAVIHQIPCGLVTTYGDVAKWAGYPGYARQVGYALSQLPRDTQLPWHRVINAKGEISIQGESLERQKQALRAEGVEVSDTGKISLKRFRWQP